MTPPKLDLAKAILADLNAKKYIDSDTLSTDDGGYDITVGDLRCIITESLKLAEENEAARKNLGWIANGRFADPVAAARNFFMPKMTAQKGDAAGEKV